ncbi:polyprenol reductase isoform X5 [Octopus sinensis]|uniref:Polyprenal reductase n=1 Tax=Octopus sinensis TaxID=2607531 RepID=A0A7E6FAV6_9MOLL|nr:polyprenol reductase isoform X5 [Octopus sinensis]
MISLMTQLWLFMTSGILIGFLCLNVIPDKYNLIHKLYLFGKMKQYVDCYIRSPYDLPKRFFKHFYLFGMCNSGIMLCIVLSSSFIQPFTSPTALLGCSSWSVSSWKQNHYCIMLSNLRKKQANQIKNTDYYIPDGDLFKFISCPHFLMEILIHVSFSMMSYFSNIPLLSLLLFVITNQLISGFLNHRWYKNMVPSYPQERRAVIPFLF